MHNLVNRSRSGLPRGQAVPIAKRKACRDLVRTEVGRCGGAVQAVGRHLRRRLIRERFPR